jgi:hypothetical protein
VVIARETIQGVASSIHARRALVQQRRTRSPLCFVICSMDSLSLV